MDTRSTARRPALSVVTIVVLTLPAIAAAQHLTPLPQRAQAAASVNAAALTHANAAASAPAASPWAPLTNQPTFIVNGYGAANPILLTDGSVLVQDGGAQDWWKLTPDQYGSYLNGTWTAIASLPADYSPLYHSSAVLPDGRLIIEGGEYNFFNPAWTAQGAIYDPLADSWTEIAPPPFFGGINDPPKLVIPQTIGDAQGVVLANGTFMQADCCTTQAALLNARTLTWTPTGAGKFDENDEEGWNLLANGTVLAVDAYVGSYNPAGTNSEIYNPITGSWRSAGSTIVQLWDSAADCGGKSAASFELGPAVLRPDGTVFYTGANSCGAGNTAIFNSYTRTWTPGPVFPNGLDIADGPAALEPNGRVLMMASPGIYNTPSTFLEWDGRQLTIVPGTPNAPNDSSFYGNMLVLPTGQILLTDFSDDVEIYTPTPPPRGLEEVEEPVVAFAPGVVSPGNSYLVFGFGFNGVSQGAAYGDDAQGATNYPLVRITNLQTGHVFYARTHDHSFMGVASPLPVWTHFDVSAAQEPGSSKLEVVANGVASDPVSVVVQ